MDAKDISYRQKTDTGYEALYKQEVVAYASARDGILRVEGRGGAILYQVQAPKGKFTTVELHQHLSRARRVIADHENSSN